MRRRNQERIFCANEKTAPAAARPSSSGKVTEPSILATLKIAILAFVTLFPIVNPLGDAPIFLQLTDQYPEPIRTLLARKIAMYGFLLLAASLILGTAILAFFGISIPVVQIAGGLVLASTGWRLLNHSADADAHEQQATLDAAMQSAFYPLTLPLTVGPGSISVAITMGAHLQQMSGDQYLARLPLFLSALFGMAAVCVLVWLCYCNAGKLVHALGPTGTTIVMRLSSFILMAIGVQIMWNGMSAAVGHAFSLSAAYRL
jgi:multiple antibiotic resistance protein